MAKPFQTLVDTLNQVEHDQSLFESELATELQGVHHEQLVKLGAEMIASMKGFVAMGTFFAEQQQHGLLPKLIEALEEYELLLMPPKVFGGFCPCLKPARSGPEYDRKFALVKAQVYAATFMAHSVVIEGKGEKLNMDSMRFSDYSNKMNSLFNTLSSISTKGNDATRETARNELLAALELVTRFLKSFEEETESFRAESKRRLAAVTELLTSRPQGDSIPISRRILVKAQSSLQEIMNSAAMVSANKARDALSELDTLTAELKTIRTAQLAGFTELEHRATDMNIGEELRKLKEVTDDLHSDAGSKLRDSVKRWGVVKAQSSPRPVAEYVEESALPAAPLHGAATSIAAGAAAGIAATTGGDPTKLLSNTTQSISNLGRTITNLPGKGVKGGTKAVLAAVKFTSHIGDGAFNAVDGAVDGVVTGAKTTAKIAREAIGIDDATPSKPTSKSQPPSSSKIAAIGNMFDF